MSLNKCAHCNGDAAVFKNQVKNFKCIDVIVDVECKDCGISTKRLIVHNEDESLKESEKTVTDIMKDLISNDIYIDIDIYTDDDKELQYFIFDNHLIEDVERSVRYSLRRGWELSGNRTAVFDVSTSKVAYSQAIIKYPDKIKNKRATSKTDKAKKAKTALKNKKETVLKKKKV